ncbi:MAG: SLATT domain-containing protein [Lachnospiraceae bacterium]|nr:SLATT domain-containing protein [Lachnospiraceae bacterium]
MSKENYRHHLRNQIKCSCGNVIYTYKTHHKLADRLEKWDKRLGIFQIILIALSSCGFFTRILSDSVFGKYAVYCGSITSVLSLALILYTKEYKIQSTITQHRNAANELLGIREKYISLLVDFEVLKSKKIRKRRDKLCQKVLEINSKYPATDYKSYKAAQKALQEDEEQTFNEGELDSILPNGID